MASTEATIAEHFAELPDPRVERTRRHSLHDILTVTLCAVISGANGWVAVEQFGRRKLQWLRTFLDLPYGIPSHDTFGRVFAALDPEAFRRCFSAWAAAVAHVSDGEVVAVDGKTLRRSFDRASSKSAVHMVNAWASAAGISLGQRATAEKSNEITAIPKLLETLALKGCIVTTDAMGCQKAIAQTVIDKEADYVLQLKGNQATLHDDVQTYFSWARDGGPDVPPLHLSETVDGDHGRLEIRRYVTTDDVDWLRRSHDWAGLQSIGMVEAECDRDGKTTLDTRYFISSLAADCHHDFRRSMRAHWSVENNLHWVLDVAFREDDCRVRQDYAAQNLATVRQLALNLLKQDKSVKVGIANKRLIAAWDDSYLLKVLGF